MVHVCGALGQSETLLNRFFWLVVGICLTKRHFQTLFVCSLSDWSSYIVVYTFLCMHFPLLQKKKQNGKMFNRKILHSLVLKYVCDVFLSACALGHFFPLALFLRVSL